MHLIFDIAFNPFVIAECTKDTTLEGLLISLSLDFVEDFTQLMLDRGSCKKTLDPFVGRSEHFSSQHKSKVYSP